MDAAELELFASSIRHATGRATGEALDAALDELGWADALASDPRAAVGVLFDSQGRANATSSALDRVLAAALGAEAVPAAVVLPALGGWGPPGRTDAGSMVVRGLATPALTRTGAALVVATAGGSHAVGHVAAADLAVRPVSGADPWLGLAEVTATLPAAEWQEVKGWDAAVAAARLALGHELVGAARRMLELAREHALGRVQFGRPIAMFQAVRHRLAETLVAIEAADALLVAAWDDGLPQTAAMAKAAAGRAARTAARHAQQVLAGIGFTTEHPFHRYLRRALVLDQLFGSARTVTEALGEEVLRTRQLPPLQSL